MEVKQVTVMVVEDSPVARGLIVATLNADPRIRVIAAVATGEGALRLAPRLAPDVISMDLRLPGMSGIEATRRIMRTCPTPVIVVASDVSEATTTSAMEAMRAGALLVVEKPRLDSAAAYQAMAARLCEQFVALSSLRVVRQRFDVTPLPRARKTVPPPATEEAGPIDVVGIVASTGGPPALAQILPALGRQFPEPVLLVQHMGAGFLEGFATWLATTTGLDVRLAHDGEFALGGCIYVGPGGSHLTYRAGTIRLLPAGNVAGHAPSGDVLFQSLANGPGKRALGVLLTGMGADGALGLSAMRAAGCHTIGQDRETSAVYGMPAAAKAMGAVAEELPLEAIGSRIRALAARTGETLRQRRAGQ